MKSLFTRLVGALSGALILFSASAAVTATVQTHRIMFDPGGSIFEFITRYNEWRASGDRVVVDGMCISACTLVTGLIDPRNICVTPYARLAFHSASIGPSFSREGTRLIWAIYPENVRTILRQRGWQDGMEHPELIYVEGAELHSIIRPCTAAEWPVTTTG